MYDLCIYGSMIVVYLALSTLLRDSMVYVLRMAPQIFVYWNTAACFVLWASSGATDTIQNSKLSEIVVYIWGGLL